MRKKIASPKKIFIIDDDKDIIDAMQTLFENNGYDVETFLNGKRGIQQAITSPPDIIVLDYFLPGENIKNIVEQLHSHYATKNIPTILVSASIISEEKIKELQVNAFLAKPFHVDTLLQLMKKCIINR